MYHITFKTNYPKLKNKEFTTIRKNSHGKYIGHDVLIYSPLMAPFVATIYDIKRASLMQLSDKFLMADTCTKSRAMAIALLNSFYKNPIKLNEKLYVFYLRRKL